MTSSAHATLASASGRFFSSFFTGRITVSGTATGDLLVHPGDAGASACQSKRARSSSPLGVLRAPASSSSRYVSAPANVSGRVSGTMPRPSARCAGEVDAGETTVDVLRRAPPSLRSRSSRYATERPYVRCRQRGELVPALQHAGEDDSLRPRPPERPAPRGSGRRPSSSGPAMTRRASANRREAREGANQHVQPLLRRDPPEREDNGRPAEVTGGGSFWYSSKSTPSGTTFRGTPAATPRAR